MKPPAVVGSHKRLSIRGESHYRTNQTMKDKEGILKHILRYLKVTEMQDILAEI